MGIFNKLFGAPKSTPLPASTIQPGKDDFASLAKEQVAHGGKQLSRKYWNSIYIGAYAPQIDMAVLKGTKLSISDAQRLVTALHDLLGEDSVGNTEWTEQDADDLESGDLHRMWNDDAHGIEASLMVDNHHAKDDPLHLSIRPWKAFREFVGSKG